MEFMPEHLQSLRLCLEESPRPEEARVAVEYQTPHGSGSLFLYGVFAPSFLALPELQPLGTIASAKFLQSTDDPQQWILRLSAADTPLDQRVEIPCTDQAVRDACRQHGISIPETSVL